MTIGLAPAGGAVGAAKLHVFERTSVPFTVHVEALRASAVLAAADLCGHLALDAWVALPAETTRVAVSRVTATPNACP